MLYQFVCMKISGSIDFMKSFLQIRASHLFEISRQAGNKQAWHFTPFTHPIELVSDCSNRSCNLPVELDSGTSIAFRRPGNQNCRPGTLGLSMLLFPCALRHDLRLGLRHGSATRNTVPVAAAMTATANFETVSR